MRSVSSPPTLFIFLLITFISFDVKAQPKVNVPPLISAPVILYDEGNNRLPDGDYQVRVRMFDDLTGDTLFEEEHLAEVRHGICHLNIGLGKAIGSNDRASSGGLDYTNFLVEGDIGVEILVEGQLNPQLLTYLATQPYSFISEMALNVPGQSISSYHIKDQSISLDDLHPSVIEQLSNGAEVIERVIETNSTPERITADNVFLPEGVVLKNSGGHSIIEVLHGIDRSLDTIREVHVKQRVSQINENIDNVENVFNNGLDNLNNQLQQEIDDRILADNGINGSLNQIGNDLQAETANRIAGDVGLENQINAEIQNRTNADNNLSGRINTTNANLVTERTNRINADTNLSDRIAQETQNRQQADAQIQQTIQNITFEDVQGDFDENSLSDNIVRVNHPDDRVRDLLSVNADINDLNDKYDNIRGNIENLNSRQIIAYGELHFADGVNGGPELIRADRVVGVDPLVHAFDDDDPAQEALQGTIRVSFLEEQPDTNYFVNLTPLVSDDGNARVVNLAHKDTTFFDVRVYYFDPERGLRGVFDRFGFEIYRTQ